MPRTSKPSKSSKSSKPLKSIPVPHAIPAVSPAIPAVSPAMPAAPGLLTQIATNATGTALGHVIAHQIIGTPSASESKSCAKEITALLQCGKENSDLNFCADFLEKLRQCV